MVIAALFNYFSLLFEDQLIMETIEQYERT